MQASEHHVDGAESRPQHSTGEVNPTENWAEATESSKPIPRPSVSSTSATGQGSSNPAHESEAVSAPPSNEQDSSRPTDDQIIAQENEIRYADAQGMLLHATFVMVARHTICINCTQRYSSNQTCFAVSRHTSVSQLQTYVMVRMHTMSSVTSSAHTLTEEVKHYVLL